MSDHSDIIARKTIGEILTPDGFEGLLNMCLLFNRESKYYKYSGWVTAALLDYEDAENQISIFALRNPALGLFTLKPSRVELRDMLENCDAFVGQTIETSFLLVKSP